MKLRQHFLVHDNVYRDVHVIPLGIIVRLIRLNHFSSMFHFYTPRKRQKNKGFLTFSRGI